MPITSTRAVLQRLMIGRLKDRGVGVHRLAELARVPVPDVWRIVEFASLAAGPEQKRPLEVGWRLLDEVKLARARPGTLGDWSRSRYRQRDPGRPDHRAG